MCGLVKSASATDVRMMLMPQQPATTVHLLPSINVILMMAHRLRRWSNTKTTLHVRSPVAAVSTPSKNETMSV